MLIKIGKFEKINDYKYAMKGKINIPVFKCRERNHLWFY